jgi:transposase
MVTQITNQIGTVLKSWGVIVDCSLLSKRGQQLIERSRERLPEHSQMVLDLWLDMLAKAQETEAQLDTAIKEEARRDEDCQILMSIPSVGPFTALAVAAEAGDISRFANAAHLISYCGLSPSVHSSGGKTYHGKLSKACNKILRYALLLRGGSVGRLRGENPLKKTYWRVVFRNHRNSAKVAVARQMIRVMYSMLKHRSRWEPSKLLQTSESTARVAA